MNLKRFFAKKPTVEQRVINALIKLTDQDLIIWEPYELTTSHKRINGYVNLNTGFCKSADWLITNKGVLYYLNQEYIENKDLLWTVRRQVARQSAVNIAVNVLERILAEAGKQP
jgi:hypothetical protein